MINFSKMQALGNDFVVIDAISQQINPNVAWIRYIADRHCGIGSDQVLFLEKARDAKSDFFCRVFNADGSEAERSGNGARCLAKFIQIKKLISKTRFLVGTMNGYLKLVLEDSGRISVNMGMPSFAEYKAELPSLAVFVGNPHAVLLVDNLENVDVVNLGKKIGSDKYFPEGANVEFMQVISRNRIRLRVYERGSGETLACGSGASAAVVAGRIWKLLDSDVTASFSKGDVIVSWEGEGKDLWLRGSAVHVFDGTIVRNYI